jgi:hypothetical protein
VKTRRKPAVPHPEETAPGAATTPRYESYDRLIG